MPSLAVHSASLSRSRATAELRAILFLATSLTYAAFVRPGHGKIAPLVIKAPGCLMANYSQVLTDGSTKTLLEVEGSCRMMYGVFPEQKIVHYLHLYEGGPRKGSVIYRVQVDRKECEPYLGRRGHPSSPVGFRCDPRLSGYVTLHLEHEGIVLAEVEIYELGETKQELYYGCYEPPKDVRWMLKDGECMLLCEAGGHLFSLEKKTGCGCASVLPGETKPTSDCLDEKAYRVYTMPRLLSYRKMECWTTRRSAKPHGHVTGENATVPGCLQSCASRGKSLATLEGGDLCYCHDEPDERRSTVGFKRCRTQLTPCSGDHGTLCGGSKVYVTYKAFYHRSIGRSTFDIVHCDLDLRGKCRGGCHQGWVGRFCLLS